MNIPKYILVLCIVSLTCTTLVSASTIDITATGIDDQPMINTAISVAQPGDIIALHGTFLISKPIEMKSNITLQGDGIQNTKIQAISPTYFSNTNMIILSGVTGVEVCNFTIHGGATSVSNQHDNGGKDEYHAGIKVDAGSSQCEIHDILFTKLYGDGIRAGTSPTNNINVYNCQFLTSGHDSIQVWNGENWQISNCLMNVFINCGVRFAGCTDCVIEQCTMYGDGNSGWCEIELENNVENIVIDRNILRDMYGSTGNYAIATVDVSGTITLSNNVIYGCSGGVQTTGLIVTDINNQYNNSNIPLDVGFNANTISTVEYNIESYNEVSTANLTEAVDNLTEIDLSVTVSACAEIGTGRYQSILNMSVSGYNNLAQVDDMTKVLYWYYPDVNAPYISVVTGYKPTVTTT